MKKNLYKILSALLVAGSLSSCLKDDSLVLNPDKGVNVIEFKNPLQIETSPDALFPLYTFSYELTPTAEQQITVSYSGPAAGAPEDIVVSLGVASQATLDDFNDEQDHEFEVLPAANYTLPETVTIKKGQKTATATIVLKPQLFDLSVSYALPLVITKVSSGTISGNFGTIVLAINIKNKWDGRYTATGTFNDVPNAGWSILSGNYQYYLQTTGANTVALFDPTYFNTYIQVFRTSPTAVSGYGSFSPEFTFDANNNVTAVRNYYGLPANGRSATLDLTGQNKFISGTPGTAGAQLQVSWTLFQPAPTVRSRSDYTFTYLGPRP